MPEGLTIKNGVISGTPAHATNETYVAQIIVVGKNLTRATLTVEFAPIAKAKPTLNKLSSISAKADSKLGSVNLPYSNMGTYSWSDKDLIINEKCLANEAFDIYFTPKDVENYDWSLVDPEIGIWNEEEGRLECKVNLYLLKVNPSGYMDSIADGVDAVYGQKLSEVELPEDENGTFEWIKPNESVGTAGQHSFIARYVPKETRLYNVVGNIKVTVNVAKLKCDIEIPTLKVLENSTLRDVVLPQVEGGQYEWVTVKNTIVEEDTEYKLLFVPADIENYEWIAGEDVKYNNAHGGYVLNVKIAIEKKPTEDSTEKNTEASSEDPTEKSTEVTSEDLTEKRTEATSEDTTEKDTEDITEKPSHVHDFTGEWKTDGMNHWKECACGNASDKAAPHNWDEGVVSVQATETSTGRMLYTCTVCGRTKQTLIPVLKHEHVYEGVWLGDDENHWKECSCGKSISTKNPHEWDDGVVVKEATVSEEGVKVYTCLICNKMKQQILAKVEASGEETSEENTEATTQKATEATSEKATEATTEKATEATSEKATEATTEKATEATSEKATEATTQKATEAATEKATEATTQKATEATSEKATEATTQKATEAATEKATEATTEKATETTTEKAAEVTTQATTEKATEVTTESKTTQATTEKTTEVSTEDKSEVTTEKTTEDATQVKPGNATQNAKAIGTKITDVTTKLIYKVTSKMNETPSVMLVGCANAKASKLVVPNTVSYEGVVYQVTAIGDKAFAKSKTLKSVTIGDNVVQIGKSSFTDSKKLSSVIIGAKVTKIGSKAFYNCKVLKSLTIKTESLTSKTVGSKAFSKAGSKNYKKLKVKVPKKKKKEYKKLLVKKGLSKKAKLK